MMYLMGKNGLLVDKHGRPLSDENIPRYCDCQDVNEYQKLLRELQSVGVPKKGAYGILYSKRLREALAERARYRDRMRRQRTPAGPADGQA